jgi:hypothetical protein
MERSKLTRIGAVALKISTLILFVFSVTAEAGLNARERRKRPKLDPDATCQLFLILPEVGTTAPSANPEPDRIDNLTLVQSQMFEAANTGQYDRANFLRKRLENQIYLQKLPSEPDAYIHSHELYKISDLSYVVVREIPEGAKEASAYELVKAFGYPVNMPVTESRSPIAEGRSIQIFHGYPNLPAKKVNAQGKEIPQAMTFSRLSHELKREIHEEIVLDSDLFLIDFLTLNPARYEENVIYERNKRLIPYDWDAGFMAGPFANFEFFDKAQSYYDISELRPDDRNRNEYYDHVKSILRDKLAMTKFDWKKAIDKLDQTAEDRLIDGLKLRLRDYQAANQVRAQICALRMAIYDGDLRTCRRLGFNLSKSDMMKSPDYRQHER